MAMRRYGGWVAASSCWLLAVWTSHRRLLHVDEGTGRAVGCNGRMGLAVEPEGQGGEAEGHGADGCGSLLSGHRSFERDAYWCMHVHRSSTTRRSDQS
jgi:hypothetical protein